ncbi:MAG: GNAT family N-acetyltransferase [Clostridia bacterium]|nr:GNAT family N-acetyltransferase [Clostridia bacterium]
MTYLKKLSLTDGIEIYTMLQEIASNDNGFHNKVCGMSFEQFGEWLAEEYSVDNGNLEDWMVPQTSYWLYDDYKPIGYGRIRNYLNDNLSETSGHVGYAIRRTEREKGYGNEILSLLLEECKKLNIEKVQIGANADNIASNRIILKHGGILVKTSNHKNFYHINLQLHI